MEARTKNEINWLSSLGSHIEKLIEKEGYSSPYEFWINADIGISRTTLNYILRGKVDVKVCTLRKIALALNVRPNDLLNFSKN